MYGRDERQGDDNQAENLEDKSDFTALCSEYCFVSMNYLLCSAVQLLSPLFGRSAYLCEFICYLFDNGFIINRQLNNKIAISICRTRMRRFAVLKNKKQIQIRESSYNQFIVRASYTKIAIGSKERYGICQAIVFCKQLIVFQVKRVVNLGKLNFYLFAKLFSSVIRVKIYGICHSKRRENKRTRKATVRGFVDDQCDY